jgi:hypothetical protein
MKPLLLAMLVLALHAQEGAPAQTPLPRAAPLAPQQQDESSIFGFGKK